MYNFNQCKSSQLQKENDARIDSLYPGKLYLQSHYDHFGLVLCLWMFALVSSSRNEDTISMPVSISKFAYESYETQPQVDPYPLQPQA